MFVTAGQDHSVFSPETKFPSSLGAVAGEVGDTGFTLGDAMQSLHKGKRHDTRKPHNTRACGAQDETSNRQGLLLKCRIP